jgi:hypothetical protein
MPKVVEPGSSIAFLSFAVEHDEAARAQFVAELKSCITPLSVDDWSRPAQSPRSDWQKLVQDQLGRSAIMIILVSKETATAANVTNEIALAKTRNVPFFGIYIDGADANTDLPAGLPRNRTIPWDWTRVSAAIAQLRREGKHHVFV